MKQSLKLLGTSLALNEGQCVNLTPAGNIPESGHYYASPADGSWGDDSILVTCDEFTIERDEPCTPAAVSLAYHAIMRSEVFRTNGPQIDLPRALRLLGNAVHRPAELPEFIFDMGEGLDCTLGDLIAGAYWSLTEWHAGQSSQSYAAMCALGQVFKPGPCSRGPEPDTGEATAYEMCNEWFASHPNQ